MTVDLETADTTDDVATAERDLLEGIRAAGLRVTLPRRAICQVLMDTPERFLTAAEVIAGVRAAVGDIDVSTVYRTLDELARLGFIHHLHVGSNQQGLWHLTVDNNHQDLVCEGCGNTTVVPLEEIAPTFEHIENRYGFRVNIHHFAILGYCAACEPPPQHPH